MESSDHNNVTNALTDLGLSSHEAIIYLSVLRLGEVSAGKVIEDVRMHREQVYRALKRLVADNLLTTFERQKRAFFVAIDPKALVQRSVAKVAVAESILPYLEKLSQHRPQIIQVNEGNDALKAHLEDILATLPHGGEYLIISGYGDRFYELTSDYIQSYDRKFKKRDLRGRILIANQDLTGGSITALPSDSFAATAIYGDKIAIEILDPDNPAIVTIENPKVAKSYRLTFEVLWKLEQDNTKKWEVLGLVR